MSTELRNVLDQIHTSRELSVPMLERRPLYIRAAKECLIYPDIRIQAQSIRFLILTGKVTRSGELLKFVNEFDATSLPKIEGIADNIGRVAVKNIESVGRIIKKIKK